MSADQTDLDLRLTAKGMRLVSGGIPMLSGAEAELDAVIAADLANSRFTFSQNKLRLNAIEVGLDGWVELKDDAVAMDVTAGACIACGDCEPRCPFDVPIIERMEKTEELFGC